MGIVQDVRLALRSLVHSPAWTALAVITLALGIGANTAIFSVLRAALLRPLPFADAERLVVVGQAREKGVANPVSYLQFVEWRAETRSLAALAAWHDEQLTLRGERGERPQRLLGAASSANLFAALGVAPELGRGFADGEDVAGKNQVVILSHATWQRLGGDPSLVGGSITLDDLPFTVVGVLPAGFRLPQRDHDIDAFVPMPRPWDTAMIPQRGGTYLNLVGRLAPGASLATAQAELDAHAARQALAFPADSANRFVTVRNLHEELVAAVRPALLVLFGAVGFVLLIACANVANLLLARAHARQREVAIRLALGAQRGRVMRQFLVESVVLALIGGAAGVLLAMWGLDVIHEIIPRSIRAIRPVSVDLGVLAFTFVVAAATGVLFGAVPAFAASAADPQEALRDGGSATPGRGAQRARSILVGAEVGVAAVLLVGAALMIDSFTRLSRVEPGIAASGLWTTSVFLPDGKYGKGDASAAFYAALKDKLAALPGADAAAIGFPMPFSNMHLGIPLEVDGEPPRAPGKERSAPLHLVAPQYFGALGIPLLVGRGFTADDDRRRSAPVVVVSRALARKLFGDADPLGRRLTISWQEPESFAVVGVVGDVHGDGLDSDALAEMYIPMGRTPWPFITFAVRSRVDADWGRVLADAVQAVDPGLPIAAPATMASAIHDSLARQRLGTVLLGVFGGVALLLALIGVYGVMSTVVGLRRQEIGIRLALGARAGAVTRMIVGAALRVAVAGAVVGLAASLLLVRTLRGLLYGVGGASPLLTLAMGLVLVGACALAAYLPARRAARIDPMSALRVG